MIENLGNKGEQVVFGIFYEVVLVIYWLYRSVKSHLSLDELHIFEAILFEPF